MATEIETFLFRGLGTHALVAFSIRSGKISMILAPWSHLSNQLSADFNGATLISLIPNDETAGEMPWDIIAIDSNEQQQSSWLFTFACEDCELRFKAKWPTISFSESSTDWA